MTSPDRQLYHPPEDLVCDFSRTDIAQECFDYLLTAPQPDSHTFDMLVSYLENRHDKKDAQEAGAKEFVVIIEVVDFFKRQMLALGKTAQETLDKFKAGYGVGEPPKVKSNVPQD